MIIQLQQLPITDAIIFSYYENNKSTTTKFLFPDLSLIEFICCLSKMTFVHTDWFLKLWA